MGLLGTTRSSFFYSCMTDTLVFFLRVCHTRQISHRAPQWELCPLPRGYPPARLPPLTCAAFSPDCGGEQARTATTTPAEVLRAGRYRPRASCRTRSMRLAFSRSASALRTHSSDIVLDQVSKQGSAWKNFYAFPLRFLPRPVG
ncbi:hypothetical protein NDU88_010555 [Pleurodeles waltl]|uniref:Uncharacterized protein n=1 Tax=Pleurodeles waltl TaxID=8319 RepID=A0AAV7S3M3_PLEWA|nr:hypothetical protein NDU88_010555 [Pleurodeles waltl]